ncbi:hypothetical protein GOP47_0014304 [Adiantum capillus-veneris]|uniref:non-specific serine/threonine protein kinase n=1 Tax=Adiantum capillus-veneris TaxID=13818 RepID=A0A9D4UM23_ADICA|nr:hypothetical protein GOP47_0014304 [Adiantum capillus-veneris]
MGCTFSGLNALYDAVSGGADVWINDRRFKLVRTLGEGGFSFVYLVKEQPGGRPGKQPSNPSLTSDDGLYALKKVVIQTEEQLELVKKEIQTTSLFNHPNLLPLIDHAIISVKGSQEGTWNQEAYLLFPVCLEGTLFDIITVMHGRKEYFTSVTVLKIFRQICAGLKYMHALDPPYAHNDLKPGNILLLNKSDEVPVAMIMDFGSAAPARRSVRSRAEALAVQEWASQHCSAPYRAPELWDCPSHFDLDERTDIWSLGCTLYALMYGVSPFEYSLGESGGSLQLAAMSGQVKWPEGPKKPYLDSLHQFVLWMLKPQVELRPTIDDVVLHVDKLIAKLP